MEPRDERTRGSGWKVDGAMAAPVGILGRRMEIEQKVEMGRKTAVPSPRDWKFEMTHQEYQARLVPQAEYLNTGRKRERESVCVCVCV